MSVSAFNVRITLLTPKIEVDDIGNRRNKWDKFYECYASVSEIKPNEKEGRAVIYDDTQLSFTIRYSKEVSHLESTKLRVIFQNRKYEVIGIDYMHYKNKLIKIHTKRVEKWSK